MCREHRRNTNAFCTASEFNNRIRIRKGEAKTGEGAHTSAHHRKPPTCFLTSPQLPTCTFLPTHGLSLYSRRVSKPPATSDPEWTAWGRRAEAHTPQEPTAGASTSLHLPTRRDRCHPATSHSKTTNHQPSDPAATFVVNSSHWSLFASLFGGPPAPVFVIGTGSE